MPAGKPHWPHEKHTTSNEQLTFLTLFRWAFSGLLTDGGRAKRPSHPKIWHIYPAVMKLGAVIPYLKKIQKIFESRDSQLEFCSHQYFFTGNQQILLYQDIQI